MKTLLALGFVTALVGCSADAPSTARDNAAGSGKAPAQASGDVGLGEVMNPQSGLVEVAPEATSGDDNDNDAGPGSNDVPQGCEPGKFCAPTVPDPDNCGTLTLKQDVEVKRVPGNLLVVFDQSLSMGEPWGDGSVTKIEAAQQAIANAVMSLQDSLTVGALFFPTYDCVPALPPPDGGAVSPIDGEGQIPFQPGPMFLQAWANHWNTAPAGLGLGTPMQEAFDRADVAIANAQLKGALAVVAVTDGDPNCFPDPDLTHTPTAPETDRASQWLSAQGVKTYVVGLPGAAGAQVLNDVAQSGGTMQYLLPDDPQMLEAKLKEVVAETVKMKFDSCSVKLTPAADPPEKLQMIVVEADNGMKNRVEHMLGPNAGWTISADGTQVEITGQLCTDAKAGRFSSITFEYGCKDVPPPPPLPTPELM